MSQYVELLDKLNHIDKRYIAPEQMKICAEAMDLIKRLESQNLELSATVERLRDIRKGFGLAINDAKVLIALIEAIDATPQQNLNAVKREVSAWQK